MSESVPDWVPDRLKGVVAEAITAGEDARREAHKAGVETARRLAGYHNPDEPRTDSEGEGDAADVPPDVAAPQPSLPDPEPSPDVPRARRTDPETSHDAARSISAGDLRASQLAIKTLLHFSGPLTDPEINEAYQTYAAREGFPPQSESGLRTRRKELMDAGFVVDSGERRVLPSGRKAIIWKETPLHVPLAEGVSTRSGTEEETASVRPDGVADGGVQDE